MIGSIDLNWREDESRFGPASPASEVAAIVGSAGRNLRWHVAHSTSGWQAQRHGEPGESKGRFPVGRTRDSQSQRQLPRKPLGGPAGSSSGLPLLSNGMAPLTRPKQKFVRSRTRLMASAPSTFRQRDVTRAVKAVTKAGVNIRRVEIDRAGKIAIITGSETSPQDETSNSLDQWLANHAHQAEGH